MALGLALCVTIAGAAGCGDDGDDETFRTGRGGATSFGGSGGIGTVAGTGGAFGDGQDGDGDSDGTEDDLTDSQIAGVMIAANAGEIAAGNVALDRATDSRVHAYAAQMVEEHTFANLLVAQLIETTALEWELSETADRISDESQSAIETLGILTGADFDLQYVLSQRTMHATVLSIIDSRLLPAADDSFLRTQLVAMRSAVSEHLQEAAVLIAVLTVDADAGTP